MLEHAGSYFTSLRNNLSKLTLGTGCSTGTEAATKFSVSLRRIMTRSKMVLIFYAKTFGEVPKEMEGKLKLPKLEYRELIKLIAWRTPENFSIPRMFWERVMDQHQDQEEGMKMILNELENRKSQADGMWLKYGEDRKKRGISPPNFEKWFKNFNNQAAVAGDSETTASKCTKPSTS